MTTRWNFYQSCSNKLNHFRNLYFQNNFHFLKDTFSQTLTFSNFQNGKLDFESIFFLLDERSGHQSINHNCLSSETSILCHFEIGKQNILNLYWIYYLKFFVGSFTSQEECTYVKYCRIVIKKCLEVKANKLPCYLPFCMFLCFK